MYQPVHNTAGRGEDIVGSTNQPSYSAYRGRCSNTLDRVSEVWKPVDNH